MKRLILLVALVMAMAVLAPAAFADEPNTEPDEGDVVEKELSAAQQWKAEMIADYFADFIAGDSPSDEGAAVEADEEMDEGLDSRLLPDVLELRAVMGWGAVFKTMILLQAGGEELSSVDPGTLGGDYGFGNLLRNLEFEGDYTNLGQLQKSYKEMPAKAEKPGKPDKIKPDKAPKKDKNDG